MAGALPSPGALILENLVLLSGSPTAFAERYGHVLTPTSFAKPATNAPAANAVLHFLLCVIDPDAATAFKPCFPILDREQERDFRRVVDARLALLEKTKLLPVGAARKSVVASAGGDRFVDLLWSLSSLAVQQVCLRHPAYGPVSRLRLISHQGRADSTLSHQSSARSTRSLMSSSTRGADRLEASRHRRFLGAGMVSAAHQRSKDAEEMRARIHAERAALARTSESGKAGAKTWASEADSLRDKIGDFEARIRRLKGQLADMGFDEHGVDIRSKNDDTGLMSGQMTQSSSGDDLGELKTSPIESMESGSSVDELPEPTEGEEITADFSKLLTFTADTRESRAEVEREFPGDKTVIAVDGASIEMLDGKTSTSSAPANPEDIVDLVRAATDELEQATNRMDEIQEARRKAEEASVSPVASKESSPRTSTDVKPYNKDSSVKELVASAVSKHKNVVESSRELTKAATELTQESRNDMKKLPRDESDDSLRTIDPVATISKPTWVAEATADASQNSLIDITRPSSADGSKCSSADEVDTAKDVQLVTQALHNTSPRKASRGSSTSSSRRLKESAKSSERREVRNRSNPRPTPVAARGQRNVLYTTPSHMGSKTPRSVRFAALPPSYRANRTDMHDVAGPHPRVFRHNTDVFPASARLSRVAEEENVDGGVPLSQRHDMADVIEAPKTAGQSRRTEKKDVAVKKESVGTRRVGNHHRTASVDETVGGSRQRGVSPAHSYRPSRTQTPRRIVRRKEVIQRSVIAISSVAPRAPESAPRANAVQSEEGLAEACPAMRTDEIDSNRKKAITEQDKDSNIDEPTSDVTEVAVVDSLEVDASVDDSVEKNVGSDDSDDSDVPSAEAIEKEHVDDAATVALQDTKQGLDETPRPVELDAVPKRLFMTPESSQAPASRPSPASSNQSKKPGFSRKSICSALGDKQSPEAHTAGHVTQDSRLASNKSASPDLAELPSSGDDELLFSPDAKAGASAKPPPSSRNADGFFAGQTAQQWQQGATPRRSTATPVVESSVRRSAGYSGMLSSWGRGNSTSSSSARKSRLQSLKARLAAALK